MFRPLLIRLVMTLLPWSVCASWGNAQDSGTQAWLDQALLILNTRPDPSAGGEISHGVYRVYEDRQAKTGRMLELDMVILHAISSNPEPDPVFVLAGGPGQAATGIYSGYLGSWMRRNRDLVFIDQRGTGGSHRLSCDLPGSDLNLQGYLDPIFDKDTFQACLTELNQFADLRFYSTELAMDDVNEIRGALGYGRINLVGGSYGTRAALVYMRRHPHTVRTATLNGVAPLSFRSPLFHAQSAQRALDLLFEECETSPVYKSHYGGLRDEFTDLMARLETQPVEVTVMHPRTAKPVTVIFDRPAFAEALRVMMYSMSGNRQVPLLLYRAARGDFRPFAENAIRSNWSIRNIISFGMLLCVTCSEDVDRIHPDEIDRFTENTFLGKDRVLQQIEVCREWPRSELEPDFGQSVQVEVPILALSGNLDPVTPPSGGAEVEKNCPNALHLVVPGSHGVSGPCITSIRKDFLANGTLDGLDTSCADSMKSAPLALPK